MTPYIVTSLSRTSTVLDTPPPHTLGPRVQTGVATHRVHGAQDPEGLGGHAAALSDPLEGGRRPTCRPQQHSST